MTASRTPRVFADGVRSWRDLYPSWTALAACAGTDPEAFFPEKGGSTREAKRVCAGCPVRVECLEYALATGQRFGVWGGMSERELRRERRRRLKDQPKWCPDCPPSNPTEVEGRAKYCPPHREERRRASRRRYDSGRGRAA